MSESSALPLAPIVAQALSIAAHDIEEIVISDIEAMIDKGYRPALEGYVLCLSRILDHDKTWNYITAAFQQKSEKIPSKYYKQFGKDPSQQALKSKGIITQ